MSEHIDIVLTRGPGPDSDFVEVEDSRGHSIRIGEWVDLPVSSGLVALRIPDPRRIAELEADLAAMTEDRDLWQGHHNDDCPNEAKVAALETELARANTFITEWGCRDMDKAFERMTHATDRITELEAEVKRLRPYRDAIHMMHNGYDPEMTMCEEPTTPLSAIQDLLAEAEALGMGMGVPEPLARREMKGGDHE